MFSVCPHLGGVSRRGGGGTVARSRRGGGGVPWPDLEEGYPGQVWRGGTPGYPLNPRGYTPGQQMEYLIRRSQLPLVFTQQDFLVRLNF